MMDMTMFAIGVGCAALTSLAVTFELRSPLRNYLIEVCCGEDRGLFWWRVTAAMLLLGGCGASIMAPALPGWFVPRSAPGVLATADRVQVLVVQLRFCWFALFSILATTVGILEYFEWKSSRRLAPRRAT